MDTGHDTPHSADPTWANFDQVMGEVADKLEEDYRRVEGFNATILNRVTGLSPLGFRTEDTPAEGVDSLPSGDRFDAFVDNYKLFLKPDYTQKFTNEGESPVDALIHGDPFSVYGEMPPRTQALIDDLLSSTSSALDEQRSTPGQEIWRGNVAGQPIEFVVSRQSYPSFDNTGHITYIPQLTMNVYRATA